MGTAGLGEPSSVLPPLHLCNLYLQTPTRSSPREGNPGGEGSPLIPFSLPSRAARLSLQVYKSAQPPNSERSARRSGSPAEPLALCSKHPSSGAEEGPRSHRPQPSPGGAPQGDKTRPIGAGGEGTRPGQGVPAEAPAPLHRGSPTRSRAQAPALPRTRLPAAPPCPRTPRQRGPHCSHKQFLSILGCSESSSFYMRRETPETRLLGCFFCSL